MRKTIANILCALFALATLSACATAERHTPDAMFNVGETIPFAGYEWHVLEVQDGKALILSGKVLEYRAYHKDWTEITWADSDIRQYLNGEFYNNFSASDRERISETRVATPDNSWYDTSGGEIVGDKIFLLSIEEVARCFGDSGALARGAGEMKGEYASNGKPVYTYTDGDGNDAIYYNYERHWIDDQYNDVRIGKTNTDDTSFWWLRSPGHDANRAAYVNNAGHLSVYGGFAYLDWVGVRPALWLILD